MLHFRVIVFLLFVSLAVTARGEDHDWTEVGARYGFAKKVHGEDFNQYEIAAARPLPWSWPLDDGWMLNTRLNAAAGILDHDGGDSAAVGSLGPSLAWISPSQRYIFEFGTSPTLISEHEFDDADLGGSFQFTSFFGLQARLAEQTTATLRIQHMSNAGIYKHNPGLDQVMLGFMHRF